MTNSYDIPKTIENLAAAVHPSFVMLAGMELDIFTPLKDGPLDATAMATSAGIDSAKATPLFHALVAIGLLRFDGLDFSNTPEADRFLVRGRPEYIGVRHQAYRRRWEAMLRIGEAVRTGKPQRGIDYANMSDERREAFFLGTFTECMAAGRELAMRQDFSKHHKVLDVGGGSGGLAIALAEQYPNLSVTIADLPSTAEVAKRYIDQAGLSNRIRVVPSNIVTDSLQDTYDAAVMRGVVPVLSTGQIRAAIANVHNALKPGSPFYILGWILDDSRASPMTYAAYNMMYICDYESAQSHTEEEHRLWLTQAGFTDIVRGPSPEVYGADYIVARKA